MNINEYIGERIRSFRSSRGIRQIDIANHIGLSRTAIVNIEQGKQNIHASQLFKIAEFLQCNVNDLYPLQDKADYDSAFSAGWDRALEVAIVQLKNILQSDDLEV